MSESIDFLFVNKMQELPDRYLIHVNSKVHDQFSEKNDEIRFQITILLDGKIGKLPFHYMGVFMEIFKNSRILEKLDILAKWKTKTAEL